MDSELRAAVDEYQSQLAAVEQLLAAEPDNIEVKEVYDQLQGALRDTLEALQQLDGQTVEHQPCPGTGAADAEQANAAAAAAAPESHAGPASDAGAAGAASGDLRPRGGAPNNARMHPANRYHRQEPNFGALAQQYDELRPYVTIDTAGRGHLNTTSWEATRALTACLLRHDFGVRWWLPEGQLVPPITNRANYIHWINDLLYLSSPPGDGSVRGMDVGCGANFIYCLLGAVMYGWTMVGIDVTKVAVQCGRKLITDNPQLAALLQVRDLSHLHPELQGHESSALAGGSEPGGARRGRKRRARGQDPDVAAEAGPEQGQGAEAEPKDGNGGESQEAVMEEGPGAGDDTVDAPTGRTAEAEGSTGNDKGILLPAFVDDAETFAFTMCNPPFFESMQEASQNPNTAFGGTAAEMVCEGGELAFVLQMLVDSDALRDRVHWFSTMVGKKSTLKALKRELHARHVTALRSTELAQGKTSRWAIAWSWQVDPNKASQPLRRLDALPAAEGRAVGVEAEAKADRSDDGGGGGGGGGVGGQEPPQRPAPSLAAAGMAALPRRHVSFTVKQAGSTASLAIMQRVQQLLKEQGCLSLRVDPALWTVTWPLQVGPFTPSNGGQQGPANTPEAATPQAGTGSWASNMTARLRIAQQQRGRVEIVATIPNTAPDAAARAFAGLMSTLESALLA